jgi:hypothetical protein
MNMFFLSASGLFDFDLTFPLEALLFFFFSLIVNKFFLSPIAKLLKKRTEFLEVTSKKSVFLVTLGHEKLYTCIQLVKEEVDEMLRQINLVKDYSNQEFEKQFLSNQKTNLKILKEGKRNLLIKSSFLFSYLASDFNKFTENFFIQKFKF